MKSHKSQTTSDYQHGHGCDIILCKSQDACAPWFSLQLAIELSHRLEGTTRLFIDAKLGSEFETLIAQCPLGSGLKIHPISQLETVAPAYRLIAMFDSVIPAIYLRAHACRDGARFRVLAIGSEPTSYIEDPEDAGGGERLLIQDLGPWGDGVILPFERHVPLAQRLSRQRLHRYQKGQRRILIESRNFEVINNWLDILQNCENPVFVTLIFNDIKAGGLLCKIPKPGFSFEILNHHDWSAVDQALSACDLALCSRTDTAMRAIAYGVPVAHLQTIEGAGGVDGLRTSRTLLRLGQGQACAAPLKAMARLAVAWGTGTGISEAWQQFLPLWNWAISRALSRAILISRLPTLAKTIATPMENKAYRAIGANIFRAYEDTAPSELL